MNYDIVTRLRDWKRAADGTGMGSLLGIFEEAADEIELLRSTVTDCRIEIEKLRSELRNYTGDHHTINAARRGDPSGVQTPSEGHLE